MVRTADGLCGLIERIFTLTGASIAGTATDAALGIDVTTHVSQLTTRSQLFLPHCSFIQHMAVDSNPMHTFVYIAVDLCNVKGMVIELGLFLWCSFYCFSFNH